MEPQFHDSAELTVRRSLLYDVKPAADISVYKKDFITLWPQLPLTDPANPLQFFYTGSQNLYINPRGCKIRLLCNIAKSDNSKLDASDKVAVAPNALSTLFDSASIELNETPLNKCNKLLGYRDYIRKLLVHTGNEKNTKLSSAGWFADTTDDLTIKNTGHGDRLKMCKLSRQFELYGELPFGLFRQQLAIPPNCSLRFTFTRSDNIFCLNSETELSDSTIKYVLNIVEATITLERLYVAEDIISNHRNMLTKSPINYVTFEEDARICHIPSNTATFSSETLFSTSLPSHICIGITEASRTAGKLTLSPFIFKNHGVTKLSIVIDNQVTQHLTYEMDTANNIFNIPYQALVDACASRSGNSITHDQFLSTDHLLVFPLETTGEGNNLPATKFGSIKLQVGFKEATTSDLSVVVLAIYPTLIQVTGGGIVKIN